MFAETRLATVFMQHSLQGRSRFATEYHFRKSRLRIRSDEQNRQLTRGASDGNGPANLSSGLFAFDVIDESAKLLCKLPFATARSIGGDLQGDGREMFAVSLAVTLQQRFDLFRSRHFTLRSIKPSPGAGTRHVILPQYFV